MRALGDDLGRNLKLLLATPRREDGDSWGDPAGAEALALRARDAGFEVVYQPAAATVGEIAQSAVEEGVHLVGLCLRAGAGDEPVAAVIAALRDAGVNGLPVLWLEKTARMDDVLGRIRGAQGARDPLDGGGLV